MIVQANKNKAYPSGGFSSYCRLTRSREIKKLEILWKTVDSTLNKDTIVRAP